MSKIVFRDGNETNYVVNIPLLNQTKPMLLRIWVAYDRGNRTSYYDYSKVKRGYYLYFSFEERAMDYPARILLTSEDNCRLYLGEVKKHSEGWYKDFSALAEKIVIPAMQDMFSDYVLDWTKMYSYCWSGKGSGVGMHCDFYKIVLPKKEWLFAKV